VVDGNIVGFSGVGRVVDGNIVGFNVGMQEGLWVDGVAVGIAVGSKLGRKVGKALGESLTYQLSNGVATELPPLQ